MGRIRQFFRPQPVFVFAGPKAPQFWKCEACGWETGSNDENTLRINVNEHLVSDWHRQNAEADAPNQ